MATPVIWQGVTYSVPAFGDVGYAQGPGNLSSYLIALANGVQTTGGLFSLTAPLNFGPNFGILAVNFTTTDANPATAGTIRLSHTDTIDWRNVANSANLVLGVNGSDQLTYQGVVLSTSATASGIVNTGTAFALAYYPAATNAVSPLPSGTGLNGQLLTSFGAGAAPQFQGGVFTTITGLGVQTQALAMGTNKVTGLASATTSGDALSYGQTGASLVGLAVGAAKITGLANGTASTDAAAFGQVLGFRVLQIITATTTTPTSSSSASFIDTTLTATITPTLATSKVFVLVSQNCETTGGNGVTVCSLQLLRAGSVIYGPFASAYEGALTTLDSYSQYPMHFLDSPATTSPTIYKTQFARVAGTGTAVVNDTFDGVASVSSIFLIEIG